MNRFEWMIVTVVMSATLLRADDQLTRVSPAASPLTDERLHDVHDVDHPASFDPQFQTKAEWEIRAARLRQQMLVALGLWPMPPRTPLNPVIHGKIDRDEYTIEKVFFSSYPGHYVSGLLYRPKNREGKLPAVLCPHGHWARGRFTVNDDKTIDAQMKIGAEGTRESAYAPQQARCAMLARMGCVVFQYDMVGMADSTAIAHRTGFNDVEAELRLQSFMGLQTWNSIRCLDFLTSLPDVDPKRIAVTGESGGGTQTMILCAIDDRPAVSVPAVMVSTHMQGGCICENCSDLRVGTNNTEFASLVAPRPQAMIAANDWTSDLETNGLPQIKAIYRLYGAEDKVTGKHFNFEHNYNQVSREFMYQWVNKWLDLGYPTPVKEKPFVPLKPEEMSVYDSDHPRPADTADAAKLRLYMTATSDSQMAALRANLPEYRKVIGAALMGMIQDRLPDSSTIVRSAESESLLSAAVTLKKGFLHRDGETIQIPFVQLIPDHHDEGRTVAIWIHPKGKASLIGEDGAPVEAARKLLKAGISILAIDVFGVGEIAKALPTTNPTGQYAGFTYAGYRFGYNKSVLSNRIHDVLTAIAGAKSGIKDSNTDLIASGDAGSWALLAQAVCAASGRETGLRRTAIDLNGFDFDRVTSSADETMLPGALKYGGIYGFAPLCLGERISLWNAPPGADRDFTMGAGLILHDGPVEPTQLVDDLLR